MLKRLGQSHAVRRLAGETLAGYLNFVYATCKVIHEPEDIAGVVYPHLPVIVTMWHGQHFMLPFARPEGWDVRVLISKSGDGEINAIAAKRLGMGIIRGSGGQTAAQIKKRGGIRGLVEMIKTLKAGASVSMTSDVPKGPARVVGEGMMTLAELSGRPIVPMAIATTHHYDLDSWDKASVHLPFGRFVAVMGGVVMPPTGPQDREAVRAELQTRLDTATERAYAIAYGRENVPKDAGRHG